MNGCMKRRPAHTEDADREEPSDQYGKEKKMPYIHSNVSMKITEEQRSRLKEGLGKAISIFEGKSEHGLMLRFSEDCYMYHQGSCQFPTACVQVYLFGEQKKQAYLDFTKEICGLYGQILHIPGEHVYITYETADAWGCDYRNS